MYLPCLKPLEMQNKFVNPSNQVCKIIDSKQCRKEIVIYKRKTWYLVHAKDHGYIVGCGVRFVAKRLEVFGLNLAMSSLRTPSATPSPSELNSPNSITSFLLVGVFFFFPFFFARAFLLVLPFFLNTLGTWCVVAIGGEGRTPLRTKSFVAGAMDSSSWIHISRFFLKEKFGT